MAANKIPSGKGLVVVKGGGDLGSGAIYRLWRAGFRVLVTELPNPLCIRRTVALAAAVYEESVAIEGMIGRRVERESEVHTAWRRGEIPVLIDPGAAVVASNRPAALVDAVMAKENIGTGIDDAPIVVALGPGFTAGMDCHAVIETKRGHYLGRAIYDGAAAPDSRVPGPTQGVKSKRVLRAPMAGQFHAVCQIGDLVQAGQVLAYVRDEPIRAEIDGVVRGLLTEGLTVVAGLKLGDIDPRGEPEYCFTISDKALAVGGGVLEAILFLGRQKGLI